MTKAEELVARELRIAATSWGYLTHLSGPELLHELANMLDPPQSHLALAPDATLRRIINDERIELGLDPLGYSTPPEPMLPKKRQIDLT